MSMNPSAIDKMMSEHRQIESVLDALDSYIVALLKGEAVDREDLPRFIRFIREFGDTRHHAKEEAVLFPAMHEAGFPVEGGPVACMLQEHDTGRTLIESLEKSANEAAWSDDVLKDIADAAIEFSGMLRSHIYKEDNMLYTMAVEELSTEAMAEVDRKCAEKDDEASAAGTTNELLNLAKDLISRHGCKAVGERIGV